MERKDTNKGGGVGRGGEKETRKGRRKYVVSANVQSVTCTYCLLLNYQTCSQIHVLTVFVFMCVCLPSLCPFSFSRFPPPSLLPFLPSLSRIAALKGECYELRRL